MGVEEGGAGAGEVGGEARGVGGEASGEGKLREEGDVGGGGAEARSKIEERVLGLQVGVAGGNVVEEARSREGESGAEERRALRLCGVRAEVEGKAVRRATGTPGVVAAK